MQPRCAATLVAFERYFCANVVHGPGHCRLQSYVLLVTQCISGTFAASALDKVDFQNSVNIGQESGQDDASLCGVSEKVWRGNGPCV